MSKPSNPLEALHRKRFAEEAKQGRRLDLIVVAIILLQVLFLVRAVGLQEGGWIWFHSLIGFVQGYYAFRYFKIRADTRAIYKSWDALLASGEELFFAYVRELRGAEGMSTATHVRLRRADGSSERASDLVVLDSWLRLDEDMSLVSGAKVSEEEDPFPKQVALKGFTRLEGEDLVVKILMEEELQGFSKEVAFF